ncbi:MAG: hypothetical protein E5Y89_27095 [Mesorhizobium sp.]|nr:MAG: hypothetical protein E5Y89_27095 [Mesorhizobium sp.]
MVLGHGAPRDATDGDQGVGAHKDGGFLMPLLQCDRTVAAQAISILGSNSPGNADPIAGGYW